MQRITTGIKATFGIVGIVTAMYWALLHAKFGLIGKVFGQEALEWANTKMSLFNDILPYFVFAVAFISGCLWLGYSIYGWIKRMQGKQRQDSMTREETIDEITVLLGKVIELLSKLK
ncbi:hypothetical protein ACFLWY_05160 [Chloroflexota bacterium]